jgi:exopolysaccharide biosynthesis protein
MRSKGLFFFVAVVLLILGGVYAVNSKLSEAQVNGVETEATCQELNEITWCQYAQENAVKAINIAIFEKPISISFTKKDATSIQNQAVLSNFALATNGTYYMDTPMNATHSGLLQIDGELISSLAVDPTKQLTAVVVYDNEENTLEILSANDFTVEDYADEKYTLFQTGPVIIKDGEIAEDEISASANGNSKAMRTLLGVLDDGRRFLLVTRLDFALYDLADTLLKLDVFQGKNMTVVNLDGGSSTAMYSRDLDNFNWRKTTRLPSIIGVE